MARSQTNLCIDDHFQLNRYIYKHSQWGAHNDINILMKVLSLSDSLCCARPDVKSERGMQGMMWV